ncbi:HTH domain-containing protein [Aggregatibacter actinomycetemcomitans]|uniref:HTH domain-containing protein n=1 Tax=Aggregatibacter actinomycetemcomitans TaxID=714 RepID=UPI002150F4BB|nr:HTH domain-containing protein [Aggregatibacter actinomycetemcomitans]
MNQKEIYQALKNKNLNASMIAEALGVSYQAVSNAIKQGKSSERITKAIALAIDQPLEIVFPHYVQKKQKQIFRKKKVNELKSQFSQRL